MFRKMWPVITDAYRYAWGHPVGVWMVWVVLLGLGLMSFMMAIYIPIMVERREVLRAAGCALPEAS